MTTFTDLLSRESVTEIFFTDAKDAVFEENGVLHTIDIQDEERIKFHKLIISSLPKAPNYESPLSSGVWNNFRVQALHPPVIKESFLLQLRRISDEKTFSEFKPEDWSCTEDTYFLLREKMEIKKQNFLIVGPTGCGKTTLLKTLMKSFCSKDRIVSIEDTPELPKINKLSTNLKTYTSTSEEIKDVTLNDLVKASLRLRPDRIFMGEMRGKEASSFLLMLSTGHSGGGATLHANSAQDALYRLEMLVQLDGHWLLDTVRKVIKNSLDFIIVVKRCDKTHRRSLHEIVDICGLEDTGFLTHTLYKKN